MSQKEESGSIVDEYTLNDIPNSDIILKFPKKLDKLKLKIKKNSQQQTNNVTLEPQIKNKYKKVYNSFYHSDCITPKYMTEYWRNIFSERSKWLVYDKQSINCNFNLLIFILKSHNFEKFKDETISSIKKMLIIYYKRLIFNCKIPNEDKKQKNCVKMLEKKWRQEGKGFIDLKNTSIDAIINSENYILSIVDIMIYSYMKGIPIVVYYESKGDVKLKNFKKNNDKGFYYFVYYSSRTNDLYLTTCKKSLQFYFDDLGTKISKSLKEKSYEDFYSYLFSIV